jgi:hypothetical protein
VEQHPTERIVMPQIQDPVIIYDIMWEAANRLTSLYVEQIGEGGIEDPAVQMIRSIRQEAHDVPVDDLVQQIALTESFVNRREELLNR